MTTVQQLQAAVACLTDSQRAWLDAFVQQFKMPKTFWRNDESDLVTDLVLENIGDLLRIHHAMSRRALSKAPFEYAFEKALLLSKKKAQLADSATNPGYDMVVDGERISLKTEAAKNVSKKQLHVSKWMEMGGAWDPVNIQLPKFLKHLDGYDRILSLRCLKQSGTHYHYELVEIPKALMLEAATGEMKPAKETTQETTPWYCRVLDAEATAAAIAKANAKKTKKAKKEPKPVYKFSLYFDAGSERKLQVKQILLPHCIVHATWEFEAVQLTPEEPEEEKDADAAEGTDGVEAIPESALAD